MEAPADAVEFSLVQGGPLYRLGQRLRLFGRPVGQVGLGVALALLGWVPLFVLAALEGFAPGPGRGVSFVASLNTHVRFLVAIPLGFIGEVWIDPRLRQFVRQLVTTGLLPRA